MKRFRLNAVGLCICALCAMQVLAADDLGNTGYHLVKTQKFAAAPGGKEYFDYLTMDAHARRIYVSHGTEVLVMNADSGALEGKLSGFAGEHGVAIADEFGKGFISDGDKGTVTIFDLKTLKKIREVKAQDDADCIIYDPSSKRVFSFNGDSKSVTAIDAKNETALGTIALGGKPEFAAADGKGTAFVNLEDKNEVVAFDTRDLRIKSRWSVAPGGAPVSMDMDRTHHRLYIGSRKPRKLIVINTDTGKVEQTLPISAIVDATVYDAKNARVFVSTKEGIIHVFHQESPDKLVETGQIKTEFGARTMTYDPITENLITDTADFAPADKNGKRAPVPGTFRVLLFGK